jgi:hypothetical protein
MRLPKWAGQWAWKWAGRRDPSAGRTACGIPARLRTLTVVGGVLLASLGLGAPAAHAGLTGWVIPLLDQQCGTSNVRGLVRPTDRVTLVLGAEASTVLQFLDVTATYTIPGTARTGTATGTFDPDRRTVTLFFPLVTTPANSSLNISYNLHATNGQYATETLTESLLACNGWGDSSSSRYSQWDEQVAALFTQACGTGSSGTSDYVMVSTKPGYSSEPFEGEPVWADYWVDGGVGYTAGVYGYGNALGEATIIFRIPSPPTGKILNVLAIVRDEYGTNWPVHMWAPVAC